MALLALYLAVGYGHALALPFLNDDYFFLEKVRQRSFWTLWLPDQLIFNWYRPWSREFHYWALNHIAGLNERFYHLVSFSLWTLVMYLYFLLVQRLAGLAAATTAVVCLAALGLWSGPLLWIAGAQDLWMLLFSLTFLHAVVAARFSFALVPLILALLSKETAAVLPALASTYLWIVRRNSPRNALNRTWALWVTTASWMVLHPTLRDRIFGHLQQSLETEHRPPGSVVLIKTLLAQANLEDFFAPESGWGSVVARGLLSAAVLLAIVLLAGRFATEKDPEYPPSDGRTRIILFGSVWAMLGWSVLFLPSIGWHAYYGVLGSFGCWLALATFLAQYRRTTITVVLALALLREARAATPSWDWGTDWYQSRAGAILASIRERLLQFHPTLPRHSRLFFARIPNNIGLLAGNGPAIRIWYEDPTLQARFYSAYTSRTIGDTLGRDYFFRFDSVQVLLEVRPGPESFDEAMRDNPQWQHDHEVLASMFIRTGNIAGAAAEYSKLATAFPGRPDYALYAGAAHEAIGSKAEARAFYRAAARAYGDSLIRIQAHELIRALPAPSLKHSRD